MEKGSHALEDGAMPEAQTPTVKDLARAYHMPAKVAAIMHRALTNGSSWSRIAFGKIFALGPMRCHYRENDARWMIDGRPHSLSDVYYMNVDKNGGNHAGTNGDRERLHLGPDR